MIIDFTKCEVVVHCARVDANSIMGIPNIAFLITNLYILTFLKILKTLHIKMHSLVEYFFVLFCFIVHLLA